MIQGIFGRGFVEKFQPEISLSVFSPDDRLGIDETFVLVVQIESKCNAVTFEHGPFGMELDADPRQRYVSYGDQSAIMVFVMMVCAGNVKAMPGVPPPVKRDDELLPTRAFTGSLVTFSDLIEAGCLDLELPLATGARHQGRPIFFQQGRNHLP